METRSSTHFAWRAFAAICIMSIVWTGIQFNCMNLYAAPVVEELGATRTQFMVVLSIPGVISAVISLLCFGAIEQRIGIRAMMLVGGMLNTIAFLTWAFMGSLWTLYLGGVLYGLGCGITAYTCVAAAVNRWFKQRIGMLVGIANSLGSAAGIVFAVVIAALIAAVGWRYSFALSVAISAVAVVACVLLYKGSPEELGVAPLYAEVGKIIEEVMSREDGGLAAAKPTWDIPFGEAVRKPRIWLLAFGYLLLGTTTYAAMSTLPLFALDLGYGDLQGQVVSASLFAAAVAMVPLGVLCDKFGTPWAVLAAGALTAMAALMLRMTALPFAAVLIAAVCAGAAYGSCGVTAGVGVKQALGEVDFSKKLGMCSGAMYVGLALGPALTNYTYDVSGTYAAILAVYVVTIIVMVVVFYLAMCRRDR